MLAVESRQALGLDSVVAMHPMRGWLYSAVLDSAVPMSYISWLDIKEL